MSTAPVLLIRRGGLGDTLLALPLLRALRRARPGRELVFAGVREFADVLVGFGGCDRAVSSEDLELWSAGRAARRLRPFGLVVGDEPDVVQVPLQPQRVEPGQPFGWQLARQAGLAPRWPDDGWLRPPAAEPGRGAVVLAPGSGGSAKCWPRQRWLTLAAELGGDRPLQILVGPAERERDDPRNWRWPAPVGWLDGLTPLELARRLSSASHYVGNDSGTTHLAAALGVPTTAIFGPTDAAVWAPVGPHVTVVAAPGGDLAALDAGEVLAVQRARCTRAQ